MFIFILFLRRPIRSRKKHLKIHSQGCFFYFQRPIIFVMKKEGINVYLLLINIFQRFLSVTLNDTSLLLILDQNTFWQRNNVLQIHMERHMCSEKRNLEWGHRPNLYTHPSPLKRQSGRGVVSAGSDCISWSLSPTALIWKSHPPTVARHKEFYR